MFRAIEKYEEPGLANKIVLTAESPDILVETVESPDFKHINRDVELSFSSSTDTTGARTEGPAGNLSGLTSPSKNKTGKLTWMSSSADGSLLALLDSGCEQSVIGRNLVRKIPLEPTEEKLSTADGTDLPLLGETLVHFSIAGFSTSCRVVVTEAVTDLILGIEWLQRNQCVWDFGSNSFTIKGTPWPTQMPSNQKVASPNSGQ